MRRLGPTGRVPVKEPSGSGRRFRILPDLWGPGREMIVLIGLRTCRAGVGGVLVVLITGVVDTR